MEGTCPLCGPKEFDASNCPYEDGDPACPTCKRTRAEAARWRDLKPLQPDDRPSKLSSSPFPFTTGDKIAVTYSGSGNTRFPTRLRVWVGNSATDYVVREPRDGSRWVTLPLIEIPPGTRNVSFQEMSGQAAPHAYSLARDGAKSMGMNTGFTLNQKEPAAPEVPADATPVPLSPQCTSLLVNYILHSYRFGMQEELRREGPLLGLTKSLLEGAAGWFGRVPKWEHCYEQITRALSKEQWETVANELYYLEIEWRSFCGPISVFSDSPANDPGWRFAHKIKSLKGSIERRIKSYEIGLIRPGQYGSSFDWYKEHKVSTMTPTVWRAFAVALDRLEELRLAMPGAKPWAEE